MYLTGSEIVVRILMEQGCDTVFGYPGGQVLDIYDSLYKHRKSIKHILTAHEQGAAHAADGYARATGKVGVVIATSGPGATNLVTGIANAYMDSVPMVAICGNVSTTQIGTDSFQEVDITGITVPITKYNFFVKRIEDLADAVRRAFVLAKTGRPGPVLVDIPKDIQTAKIAFSEAAKTVEPAAFAAKDVRIEEAAALINSAKRPLIYFGGGLVNSGAEEEMMELARVTDAPIACSMMGISAIPSDYPGFLGMQGVHGHLAATLAMQKADVIVALGVRFNDRVTGDRNRFALKTKVVHIDIDGSELAKTVDEAVSLRGDLKLTLNKLLPLLEKNEKPAWRKHIEELKAKEKEQSDKRTGFTPYHIMQTLNGFIGKNTPVATDVGQHQVWAAQELKFFSPRRFLSSGGLGTMGYGLGASIGAYFGTGERGLLITGDGSFGMSLNELATAVTYKVPVVIVIMDNGVLGMVRQMQTVHYKKRYSSTVLDRKTDFAAIAKGFGADGEKADSIEELEAALMRASKAKGPYVIDCHIDKDEEVSYIMPSEES